MSSLHSATWRRAAAVASLAFGLLAPASAFAAFGLTTEPNFYTVDTGADLVFKVRRVDNSSTTSTGDIASLVYKGVEYQNLSRGTQINSGFDWLYNGVSAVTLNAETVGADIVKVTVQAGSLTHYYIARRGEPRIYMGTYFTAEPNVHGLVRYIVRVPQAKLPNGPQPSDIRNNTGAIESGDVFKLADGTTRSKHYSNMRLKDWSYIGATGTNVGLWIVRDNHEGGSGGPFYRSLLNQCGSDQEITYIVNYGEAQTEAFRMNVLNMYTMVFTDGTPPPASVDTSWFADLNLLGYLPASGRGAVVGTAITGREPGFEYTVGFANAQAQYWAAASPVDGAFECSGMRPGTYTLRVYKNELAVYQGTVTVAAGEQVSVNTLAITADPSNKAAAWRIGDWDGSPVELLNGDKLTIMHPSDVRMSSWVPAPYEVGVSTAAGAFPAYQWKNVNNPITIKFNLTADQIAAYQLRVGMTCAFAGGRPMAKVNAWSSPIPAAPSQPKTRTLTVGTYRGNNLVYTYEVPASALVVGENVLTLTIVSGSSGSGYLSPGMSYDVVDFCIKPPVVSSAVQSGTYGDAFSFQIAATNQPTQYGATGLPPGLVLDATTGIISGTLGAAGSFTVDISASNANGSGSSTLTLEVAKATAAVSLGSLVQSYDGTPKAATATTSPAGLNVVFTYDGGTTAPTACGTYAVTATVEDANYVGTATGTLSIVDTTPPVFTSLTASRTTLWPVNHKLMPVKLAAAATDDVSTAIATKVVAVSCNEASDGNGDGNTEPDWEITGDMSVNLRAERSGTGTGRVYTITVEAKDEAGNASTSTVTVEVPHDAAE